MRRRTCSSVSMVSSQPSFLLPLVVSSLTDTVLIDCMLCRDVGNTSTAL